MEKTSPREVLLRHGKWITAKDFVKLFAAKRNVSDRQAKTLISEAYRNKEIKKHIFSDRTVIYGLTEFGPPTSPVSLVEDSLKDLQKAEAEQKNVMDAIKELRRELRFFREPTVDEVAVKTGRDPETVKPLLYALAQSTGWKPQSQEQAKMEAEDAINLTCWLCWKEKGEQNPELEAFSKEALNNASVDTFRRAKNILTNYPELVPKFTPTAMFLEPSPKAGLTELRWPEETKVKWRHVFSSELPPPQILSMKASAFQSIVRQWQYNMAKSTTA